MVNPSTESILNQMTNLAMDIALDYVLPASPMSDVCKGDLYEFEREVVNIGTAGGLMASLVGSAVGTAGGCCGRPPADLCKKNSYMGAAGCDSCDACLAKSAAASSPDSASCCSSSSSSSSSSSTGSSSSQTAETTMDISWCQFDGCEFDTADNSYLDICDWIFYADRYALTDENREKVQKAFQMVPPGEVTGYVCPAVPAAITTTTTIKTEPDDTITIIKSEIDTEVSVKSEPTSDDDYLWSSDNHLQPIILKAEPNADILQITELDHSYLQTGASSANSSAAQSPAKHHHLHHHNHLVDMLGLVTPPPSRSQSSEEEEIDVVNDSWDTPDTPRKGATMADIMKRGIVKKREPPVTKWKNTVKRKHKTTLANAAVTYPMPPPPPKKLCSGGLSLLDRYKKDTTSAAWKEKEQAEAEEQLRRATVACVLKKELIEECQDDEDDDYDMDAAFESLMKNEPEDMFDEDFDADDDENDVDWDTVLRGVGGANKSSSSGGGGGGSSSCSSSTTGGSSSSGRKKKKKKKSGNKSKHQSGCSGSGKKLKYDSMHSSMNSNYNYKTKLMDPVKRALHNDLEKSRRVETSMLFMNLSQQVSFLDDNRKIPSKLSILRGAKRECDLMMLEERRLMSEKHVMQQKQRMLRERLFELRREQFHRRYGKNSKQQQQESDRQ